LRRWFSGDRIVSASIKSTVPRPFKFPKYSCRGFSGVA
jgi:hypothetical protein